jgi:uncharacterized NAD(P)/FAD-binding protein YdhS
MPIESESSQHSTDTAIIGGGFCGTLAAINLLKSRSNTTQEITIIERRSVIGPGLAYSGKSEAFKLNVPVSAMSPFEDQPNAFLEWLSKRRPETTPDEFVARYHYGDYLNELLSDVTLKNPHNELSTIRDEVIDLQYNLEKDRFILRLKSGDSVLAHRVILAIGNLPREEELFGVRLGGLLNNPYDLNLYNGVAKYSDVIVIGSGLTAVDCVLECESRGFKGSYTIISRHAKLPLPHEAQIATPNGLIKEINELSSEPRLRELVSLARRWGKLLGSSQPIIVALRGQVQRIWMRLSREDKGRFLRHLRHFWDVHRHRIPAQHQTKLEQLRGEGRLQVLRGAITEVIGDSPKGVKVKLKGGRDISGAIAFLCAGQEGDLERVRHPLIVGLLREGIIAPGEFKLGISGKVNLPQGVRERFQVIGPLRREELWEITAVRELRVAAADLAR